MRHYPEHLAPSWRRHHELFLLMTHEVSIPAFLRQAFDIAVAAAHPSQCLEPYLPADRTCPVLVLGAGKAAASMARAFEEHWSGPVRGLVVTRYGHGAPCRQIEVVEADHPVPDNAGLAAAKRILTLIENRRPDEQIFLLLSGGASALLVQPAPGITLAEKQSITRVLLHSGATIGEINCVRKHLSAIKGGRLAQVAGGTSITTLAISDVVGDDPAVIGSGPTVPDPTSSAQALALLDSYGIALSEAVKAWLENPTSETPKPGQVPTGPYHCIANPMRALNAAADFARQQGITPLVLGDRIEGEAREVAKVLAGMVQAIKNGDFPVARPCLLLSGGETTVTLRGKGRGGRNTEFLLGLAMCLEETAGIFALAADTDGLDGTEDNAGALITPDTLARAKTLGVFPHDYLTQNDSYGFFAKLGDLLITGPTRTNVNDFRAIYIA
jgi:glycerate 2-kinase